MKWSHDAAGRIEALGRLGLYLQKLVPDEAENVEHFSFNTQTHEVSRYTNRYGCLVGAAVSLLLCKNAVQVQLTDSAMRTLLYNGLGDIDLTKIKRETGGYNPDGTRNMSYNVADERRKQYFPLKKHRAAISKVPVSVSDLITAMQKSRRVQELEELNQYLPLFHGLYNDQVAAGIIYAQILDRSFSGRYELSARALHHPKDCKAISTVIKSLGMNCTHIGSMLCEIQNLQGRGVAELNVREEAEKRCTLNETTPLIDKYSDDNLRQVIRKILVDEIGSEPVEFDEPTDFWTRRWLWCVNGGHSRVLENNEKFWTIDYDGRAHRRVAMENWDRNPIEWWSGQVYVSASQKLEHGKSRLLLACDTASYVVFEHLLKPIERRWRNNRVLLDPGKLGHEGTAYRVNGLRGNVNVMMDFDAFDTQHSLKSQKIVIDEVTKFCNYDTHLAERMVDSFDNMHIFEGGKKVGKAKYSLMSGHRATTFLNSVLNAAYVRMSCGELWGEFDSLHTGDDVVAKSTTMDTVGVIIDNMRNMGCRLNPMKQSIGSISSEFLRMSITNRGARGYAPRAIATFISGNWVNMNNLEDGDKLRTAITTARSILNRCGTNRIIRLLAEPIARSLSIKIAYTVKLLETKYGLDESPVYNTGVTYKSYHMSKDMGWGRTYDLVQCRKNATTDYLTWHVTPVERDTLITAKTTVNNLMLEASYAKSLTEDNKYVADVNVRTKLVERMPRVAIGWEDSKALVNRQRKKGMLEHFPVLTLLKNRLSNNELRLIFDKLGYVHGKNIRVSAWGQDAQGKIISGIVSYSDAAAYCGKTERGIIYCVYPVRM